MNISCRRVGGAVVHKQDMVAPLCPAAGSELISCEGKC
jgi:hypothetical protein